MEFSSGRTGAVVSMESVIERDWFPYSFDLNARIMNPQKLIFLWNSAIVTFPPTKRENLGDNINKSLKKWICVWKLYTVLYLYTTCTCNFFNFATSEILTTLITNVIRKATKSEDRINHEFTCTCIWTLYMHVDTYSADDYNQSNNTCNNSVLINLYCLYSTIVN